MHACFFHRPSLFQQPGCALGGGLKSMPLLFIVSTSLLSHGCTKAINTSVNKGWHAGVHFVLALSRAGRSDMMWAYMTAA